MGSPGGHVGRHVAAVQEVYGLQVRQAGRADTVEVGLVATVGGQLDAEIALGHVKALRGRQGSNDRLSHEFPQRAIQSNELALQGVIFCSGEREAGQNLRYQLRSDT
jgi:hypothetical protein